MNPPPLEERIAFWKHAYARASFVDARIFLEQILEGQMALTYPVRKALSIAALVTYCRPFKQREAVRLPGDVIPAKYHDLHDSLIEMRDKVVAHRDLDGPIADWGFISQLEIAVAKDELVINTNSPVLPDQKAKDMLPLCDHLIATMDEVVNAFAETFLGQLASQQGIHVLCLDDANQEWTRKVR